MNRTHKLLNAFGIVIALGFSLSVGAQETPPAPGFQTEDFSPAVSQRAPSGGLWRDRGNIGSLNLFYGPGGTEHQPAGKFTFVKEDKEGTSPKFDVLDEQGVRWRVKLGEETKSETAATRLVWAAGYYTDQDYYLPELRVAKMPKLTRGHQFVSPDGVIHGVRMERKVKGEKKSANWSWSKNPFVGTKELDGLRIMMALINNWDLKEVNNAIYDEKGGGPRYVISDLGASFGETGNSITRSKSNLEDYTGTPFVQNVTPEHVDFFLSSRPFVLTVFNVPNYVKRTNMQGIAKHIPLEHAKWLGHLLGQLSDEQLRDCFRAAGYSKEAVEGYAATVKERINDLNRI